MVFNRYLTLFALPLCVASLPRHAAPLVVLLLVRGGGKGAEQMAQPHRHSRPELVQYVYV